MRCLLILFVFTAGGGLFAQPKADTLYNSSGAINQIRYSSVMDTEKMSKADLFMRGIQAGDLVRKIDSVEIFDASGKRKIIQSDLLENLSPAGTRNKSGSNGSPQRNKAAAVFTTTDYVEGRAGMQVRRKVPQPVEGKSLEDIKRIDNSPEIELEQGVEGENGGIVAKVRIPAGATQRKLIIDFGDGKQREKLYTIRGYHLNESDFKREDGLTDEQTWYAKGQNYLYLRLRSTEKLLYISRGGTRYKSVPVGRQLDEVYLKELPAGKYLLGIVDLGSQEKRYHWIVIGD